MVTLRLVFFDVSLALELRYLYSRNSIILDKEFNS